MAVIAPRTTAFPWSQTDFDRRWATIVADLRRREFLLGAAGAALLAGCGRGESGGGEAGPDTVRAETPFGTFEVPLNPQRVVILEGRQDLETSVVLELPRPVGLGDNAVDEQGRTAGFLGFDAAGVTLMPGGKSDLEKIAALRPDLIMGRASNIEPVADKLATLAPLVPVELHEADWRTDLETAGAWTGRSDRVARALAAYDELLGEVKTRHSATLGTATAAVIQPGEGGAWYSSRSDGFLLQSRTLRALGGTPVPAVENASNATEMSEFSAENLGHLDAADVILVASFTADHRAQLEASPLWSRLPAVRAGRIVHTDIRTNRGSVLAAGECLRLWDRAYSLLR